MGTSILTVCIGRSDNGSNMLVGSLLFSLLLVAETFFHFAIINAKELIRAGRHVHEIRFMLFDLEEAIMFTPKPQEYTDPLTGEMKKKQMKFFPDTYRNRIGKSYNDYIADHQMNMDVSKFYHGDYYLEEEVKTMRGKGIASRKKSSI